MNGEPRVSSPITLMAAQIDICEHGIDLNLQHVESHCLQSPVVYMVRTGLSSQWQGDEADGAPAPQVRLDFGGSGRNTGGWGWDGISLWTCRFSADGNEVCRLLLAMLSADLIRLSREDMENYTVSHGQASAVALLAHQS